MRCVLHWVTVAVLIGVGDLACAAEVRCQDFASLAEAVKAAAGGTLLVSTEVNVPAETAIPADVQLQFANGGRLRKQGSARLQIEGPVAAPLVGVFAGFAPGEVKLSGARVLEVYPQWWGAKADGVSDDTPAIQAAIDSGVSTIVLPQGNYLIRKTINLTNRANGLTVRGAGRGQNGSVIIADTGGVAIDATGARDLLLERFCLTSGQATPSTVGILFARSQATQCVEFNTVQNLRVLLKPIREANGGNGTVAIYNNAAELWRAHDVYLVADNSIVFTGSNIFGITSTLTRHFPDWTSMSVCSVDGSSTLHAYKGAAVTFENACDIEVLNAYVNRSDFQPTDNPYPIRVVGYGSTNLTYTGHIEGFQQVLYSAARVNGLKLQVTKLLATDRPLIYLDGNGATMPGLLRAVIDAPQIMPSDKPVVLIKAEGKCSGVQNSEIYLDAGQQIDVPMGRCTGNRIYSTDNDPKVRLGDVAAGSSCMILSGDGIRTRGPAKAAESK